MLDAFIVFCASFLVLSGILLHKIWELRRGHTFISKGVLPKSDSLIKEQIDFHKEVIVGGGKRGMTALSLITKESTKHFFLIIAHYLHDKLTEAIFRVRGKAVKHSKGVSFFLKRVEEYKEEKKDDMIAKEENVPKEEIVAESGERIEEK